MRLRDNEIELVAKRIVENVCRKKCIDLSAGDDEFLDRVKQAIVDDLMIEDNLNREVEEIMKNHTKDIQERSIDYRRMFAMIKNKLAKDRNLILS